MSFGGYGGQVHTHAEEAFRQGSLLGQRFTQEDQRARISHFHSSNVQMGEAERKALLPSPTPAPVVLPKLSESQYDDKKSALGNSLGRSYLSTSRLNSFLPHAAERVESHSNSLPALSLSDPHAGTHRAITAHRSYPAIGWKNTTSRDYGWNVKNSEANFHLNRVTQGSSAVSSVGDRIHHLNSGVYTTEADLRQVRGFCRSWQLPDNSINSTIRCATGSINRVTKPTLDNIGSLNKGFKSKQNYARSVARTEASSTTVNTMKPIK